MQPSVPALLESDPSVARIVGCHGTSAGELLTVLQDTRRQCGELTAARVGQIADALRFPHGRVAGVASFYSLLAGDASSEQTVRVCDGIVCWMHGARDCRAAIEQAVAAQPGWCVTRSSCLGLCDRAPAAFVNGRQLGPLSTESVDTVFNAEPSVADFPNTPRPGEHRLLLQSHCGVGPASIGEPVDTGTCQGLRRALAMSTGEVIAEVEASGLCGRGGAGFPTARKWRTAAESNDPVRYVVCNADESEPLMFKDRVLLESDPQSVLEGLAIAAYAVNASEAIVYIRGEYEPQARILEDAIVQAEFDDWLGDDVCGSGYSLHVRVHRGAGAYICGEESALLESLEGRRGEPRIRPPFPAQSGYLGHPTVVNNVETLATAAAVLRVGAGPYRRIGSPEHPGTRLFTLTGHIARPGIVEVPQGLTLRQLIEDIGGGMRRGSTFQFALTSGAAGTLVGRGQLDVHLDRSARSRGISVGSGGILICDETVSPVAVLRELMHFFETESCGKCTPCRIGTFECREICDRLLARQATAADLARLRQVSNSLRRMSLCGLGVSAADPIESALDHFSDAFERLVQ